MLAALVELCVPVPSSGADVCPVCHGWRRRGFELCSSCQRVRQQVSGFCRLVAPISLCVAGESALYAMLAGYKSGGAPLPMRLARARLVGRLFEEFLSAHGSCIAERAGSIWDAVTTVPSSSGRSGTHPLAALAAETPALARGLRDLLSPGQAAISHLVASDDGYTARGADGRRVLLLEDTFTSGARAQSAASALVRGGAEVVGIVAAARLVRPVYGSSAAFWARQRRRRFEPSVCCLEG